MPTPHVVAKVLLIDPAANRFVDQLLAVLNPILRNVAGDLRGPVSAPTVAAWLGVPLDPSMAAPVLGQVPTFNGTAWVPGAGGGGGVSSVTATAPLTSTGGATPNLAISGSPAGGVAYADGTTLAYTAAGTAGLPLLSAGAGAPSFGALALNGLGTVSGLLPIANGGTNTADTPVAGGVPYGTGSAFAWLAAGSPGEVLVSNGASPPSWAPAAAGSVTSVSVALGSAAYASIANPTTTPELSLDVGTVAGSLADGGDSRFNPTPSAAGGIPYDTGSAWQALPIGAAGYVLTVAGGLPAWAVPSASFTGAGIGAYRATTTSGDTVALTDYVVDVTTTGAFVLNLPAAGSGAGQAPAGRVFIVKNSGGAVVTVTPAASQTIDTAATLVIETQFASFTFVSTGSSWVLV